MVIEGMLALTGQHFIMDYNERMGTLPGFVKGFTLVARDEHRHVAFGARFLRDMARRDPRHTEAIQRTLAEVAPVADGVLRPKWFDGADDEPMLFGASVGRDARVRDEGARAADEGHRAGGGRVSAPRSSTTTSRRSTCGSAGSSRSRTSPRRASRPGSSRSTSARRSGVKRSSAQVTNYAREELEGRLVVGVVNFPPRQIGPVRSEVLVLGASDAEGRVILLGPGSDVPLGARIH